MRRRTPVSRNPELVRGRILAAAEAEFMRRGYDAASTNRITRAFGGSKATLFRYYADKSALLEAVVQRIAQHSGRAIDWAGIEARTPERWLRDFAERALAWILGPGPLFVGRLAITERQRFPKLEQAFLQSAGQPIQIAVEQQLRRWHRERRLSAPDAARLAESFIDLAIGGPVSRALYGEAPFSPHGVRAHLDHVVPLFLHGCARRSAGRTRRIKR